MATEQGNHPAGSSHISKYLERDHERLENLLKQYMAVRHEDFDRAAEYFQLFKEGLLRHMIWEEEILFPLFERTMGIPGGGGPMRLIRIEHRMIETYLEQVHDQIKLRNPYADDAVRKLAETLEEHSRREERAFYPAFDQAIGEDEVLHIIRSMEHMPKERPGRRTP